MKQFVFISFILITSLAQAQLDSASRDLLIDKLGKVQSQLPANDPSTVTVTLRLADLLSERARLDAMKDLEQGCTNCTAGIEDRKKALRLYTEALERAPMASKGKVLIQMGHLSQMNGAEDKAATYYQKVLNENADATLKAEAYLALGELAFKRHQFPQAISHYEHVLAIPTAGSKGLAAYRKAWSIFNMGEIEKAQKELEIILKTPALLTRSSSAQAQVDPQFQEEISRDYATFISKGQITAEKIESLYKLSPEAIRIQNVQTLAADADRLGRKKEALAAWKFIFPYLAKPEDRLNAYAAQAQLNFDLGDKNAAWLEFTKVMETLAEKNACAGNQCDEIRRRVRQFVVAWNQTEKKQPSAELLQAYQQYTERFPEDLDMLMFAGQVAKEQNKLAVADGFYEKAKNHLARSKVDLEKLENILLLRIEIAESLKDEAKMTAAYQDYLANSPKQTRSFQVRYQIARGLYESNRNEQAAVELQKIALDPKGDEKIRKQAADLSLDALVLLKDDTRLQAWSTDYAKSFKGNQKEFSQIAQKTVLTKAAASASSNPTLAYQELAAFKVDDASAEDRIKYYKNKMILADQLKIYGDVATNADLLLKQPGLSAEDTELAWAKKAHVAELRLDFPTAIVATEKLQKAYNPEDKALKLALFSELSGQQNSDRYIQYLKVAKDPEAKQMVAQELVRKSKNPEKEIEALKMYLAASPEILARLYAEIQAKNPASAAAKKVTTQEALRKTSSGQLLSRIDFLKDFEVLKTKITASKLDTSNDRKLAASIKARAALLEQVEGKTKIAIERADWTSQLVSIDTLAKESDRFYQELMTAPMPEGLSDQEQQEYMNLLSNQAAPFQAKATAAKEKVEQFWKNPTWLAALQKSWNEKPLRSIIQNEIKALQAIATAENQAQLAKLQENTLEQENISRPKAQEIAAARSKVYQQPMDKGAVEELLSLEKKSDNKPMVQYLQTRLENLNKGVL